MTQTKEQETTQRTGFEGTEAVIRDQEPTERRGTIRDERRATAAGTGRRAGLQPSLPRGPLHKTLHRRRREAVDLHDLGSQSDAFVRRFLEACSGCTGRKCDVASEGRGLCRCNVVGARYRCFPCLGNLLLASLPMRQDGFLLLSCIPDLQV